MTTWRRRFSRKVPVPVRDRVAIEWSNVDGERSMMTISLTEAIALRDGLNALIDGGQTVYTWHRHKGK